MIAEYLTRRDAEIYASELTKLYGPAVHFDVVSMRDPVFGDTVWYVLGTGTIDGETFAQYAEERKLCHNAADVTEKPSKPAGSKQRRLTKETDNELC
jgi:hypothetical protein